jgi:hypothetical protein
LADHNQTHLTAPQKRSVNLSETDPFQQRIDLRTTVRPPMVKNGGCRKRGTQLSKLPHHGRFEQGPDQRMPTQCLWGGDHLQRTGQPGITKKSLRLATDPFDRITVVGRDLKPLISSSQHREPTLSGLGRHSDFTPELRMIDLLGSQRRRQPCETTELLPVRNIAQQPDIPLNIGAQIRTIKLTEQIPVEFLCVREKTPPKSLKKGAGRNEPSRLPNRSGASGQAMAGPNGFSW